MLELINSNKNWKTYFSKFEDAVKKSVLIKFNNKSVEFPNMVIFSTEEKGMVYSLLNPGVDILKTSEISVSSISNSIPQVLKYCFNLSPNSGSNLGLTDNTLI